MAPQLQPRAAGNMLRLLKMAAAAAGLLLATTLATRAADTATVDDTARFLAGLPPSEGSPLMALTKDSSWQHHARFFDNAFAQLEQRQLSKVRAWADTNLAAPKPTMFYFFSGPDFLYANAFYSKANTYVMAALEPSGSVPDLAKLPRGSVDAALANIEHSLGNLMSFSFFITKHMKVDLHAGQISGALPLLLVFIERSGKTIRDVTPVALDDEGKVLTGSESTSAKSNAPRGVRILFADKDDTEKTLYYFSTDLSNTGVRSSGFLKFCATLAPGNSLIKSASYLLHSGSFTATRDFLLNNSATIIQDDSGIPLSDYNSKKWRFFPFGHYAGPISEFPNKYQESYAELFRRAQPLDFGIGYRWRTHDSNLLLSVKLNPDEVVPAETTASTEAPPPPAPRPRAKKPRPPMVERRNSGFGGFGGFFWFR
jgi:hypothetical protein